MANLAGQRTGAQIVSAVDSILFNKTSGSANTYPTSTTILELINRYYKTFVDKYQFLWAMKSTTASTSSGVTLLTMPDDCIQVYQMQIRANGRYLQFLPRKTFERMFPAGWTSVGNSQPIYYVEAAPASNNAIQFDLFPTPDATYTINYDYRARFTPLVGSTEVSVIPPEYDMYLIYGPAMEGLIMLGDPRAKQYAELLDETDKRAWMANERLTDYQNSFSEAPTAYEYGLRPGQVLPYLPNA
jgi:hypothetical protein